MAIKTFDLNRIGQLKQGLGYNPNSLNLIGYTGAGQWWIFLSYWFMFTWTWYNISFEENGILLIPRSKWTNKYLPEKHFFISNAEIQSIRYVNSMINGKLEIFDLQGKKTVFRINKTVLGASWQKENLKKVREFYEVK